jgi:hypothetical protein
LILFGWRFLVMLVQNSMKNRIALGVNLITHKGRASTAQRSNKLLPIT